MTDNVFSLDNFKNKKVRQQQSERNRLQQTFKLTESKTEKQIEDEELKVRIQRIKDSIVRINELLGDLRNIKPENNK